MPPGVSWKTVKLLEGVTFPVANSSPLKIKCWKMKFLLGHGSVQFKDTVVRRRPNNQPRKIPEVFGFDFAPTSCKWEL